MGWTEIFKKAKLKADPRIRWFGKLPTYPDYYSSPADEDWVIEFNDFVLKGFEVLQRRMSGAQKSLPRLPVSACTIRLPKSEMTVFGTFLDFGGDMRGRPFPMCFYVGVPTSLWPGPDSDRLVSAARALRDLLSLRREVASFINSPGRFETVFSDRQVDLSGIDDESVDDSWTQTASSIVFADWFDSVRDGLKEKDSDTWLRLVRCWGDNLATIDDKSFEPTMRFPLAMRMPLDVQIAGWLRWLESRMDLRRRMLSMIVSGDFDDSDGGLTVVAREIVPEDFLLFAPGVATLPYLDDLSAVADGEEAEAASGAPDDSSLRRGQIETWIAFVEEAPC
ncbi:MAG: DUF2094 domain-containing protein [Phycisphaerales bacterium]|nr:MAG: DUF2094 domain-containing protein [Phycisphaerales bacterium]